MALPMDKRMAIKVLAIGDTLTDKSATLQYMVEGKADMYKPSTIGVDYGILTVPTLPGSKVPTKVMWWDTGGKQLFRTIMTSYFKAAQCVVVFYSVSSAKTLDCAIDLVHQLWSTSREGKAPIILVGACAHLECERAVTTQEGVAAARKLQHEAQEYV